MTEHTNTFMIARRQTLINAES